MPEEGRYPAFNTVVTIKGDHDSLTFDSNITRFKTPRSLTVGEFHRLAPAADLKKSAILVEWDDEGGKIAGLVDLGTSWYRARAGLAYKFTCPSSLIIQADRPGRLRVYQGQFAVAELADGKIRESSNIDIQLFMHRILHSGLAKIDRHLERPAYEYPKEYLEFEFIALYNVYSAIINEISAMKHGGMLIIRSGSGRAKRFINTKYETHDENLKNSFLAFINSRHKVCDCIALHEDDHLMPYEEYYLAELHMEENFKSLIENIRFISRLSGCDGSIMLSDDLTLLGFGIEISANFAKSASVFDIIDEMKREYNQCDFEQFGMRHRSAIKLVSRNEQFTALVSSQDGPISAVWKEDDAVFIKKNINFVNMNLPWG